MAAGRARGSVANNKESEHGKRNPAISANFYLFLGLVSGGGLNPKGTKTTGNLSSSEILLTMC